MQTVESSLGVNLGPLLLLQVLVPLLFWIVIAVIAWRAMRAHERIADALSKLATNQGRSDANQPLHRDLGAPL